MRRALVLAWALWPLAGAAFAADLEPAPVEVDAGQLARRIEESLRSEASYLEATVRVVVRGSDRQELRIRSWDDRLNRRSFIRVLGPAEKAGTGFLRVGPNVWSYRPKGEGARRIAPEELQKRWMGSHFTHDDLLNVSSEVDDYRHRMLGIERSPEWAPGASAYVLEYLPRKGAAATWGRIVAWVETRSLTPLRIDYFDDAGVRVRELRFEDLRAVQGRHFPHRWRMIVSAKKARESVLEVREVRFDQRLDTAIFTTRHLRKDP